jgi:hypothetical protein
MSLKSGPDASGAIDAAPRLRGVGGLIQSVGNGITGLVGGAFEFIGTSLRGMFHAAELVLPGGMLFVVAFLVVTFVGWNLIKR